MVEAILYIVVRKVGRDVRLLVSDRVDDDKDVRPVDDLVELVAHITPFLQVYNFN